MRLLSVRVLLFLTIGALIGAPSQSADIARQLKGLEEFLKWAHPEGEGCPSPADISIVETWDGGLRARYGIGCGASTRPLQGIFQVREKEGVWQIASGFEADAPRIDAALGAPPSGPAGEAPAGISPPPKNAGGGAPETPLDAVAPPAVRSEASPEYPEEAGRARLIGEAHIELLVEVAPDGAPLRARPLRGPDPDLGMRRAAMEAVMRWRFDPARLAGKPLTYFRSVDVTFSGLPPESRDWVHRALFRVEAVVSEDELVVDEALRRVRAGEAFEKVAAESVGSSAARGGDWGLVSAATLPAAVRRALHEARVGGLAGPVAAEGLHYLILKRGEVYYALKPRPGGDLTYQILHQKNAPEGDALKQAVERDIADYLAESRRQTYVNEAARLMGIRQSSAQVGQLEIRTDVLSDDEIKTLGQVVDSVVRTQEAFWSPLVALRPFNQQVLVYAWAREADHDRLHRMWQAGPGGPEPPAEPDRATSKTKLWSFIGEYLPASHILSVPCERMGGHLNVPILIHEGIHMLDYERVYAAGTVPSQWFEEGLATYFGFSQIGARLDIEPGDIRRSGTIVSGNVRLQFDPRTPLQEYLRKIRDDGPMPLRALLESGAGDPTWTGERTIRAYCASWTLVHFLLHGARGGHRAAFEEYARAEARGAGGYDTFVRLFGPDLASLEAAWHRYEEDL